MSRLAFPLTACVLLVLASCDPGSVVEPAADPTAPETVLSAQPASSQGMTRSAWPSADDPGPPFYARLNPVRPLAVDGWVVIPFYRDPGCVPPEFNFLDFFDVPGAFFCVMTVRGASLWPGEVDVGAPHTITTMGLGAVPVWFVPEGLLLEALQGGVVTIGDLAALPGRLIGSATQYNEVLQPEALPPEAGGGGNPISKLILNARGTLEDGRRFSLHHAGVAHEVHTVRLRFW